MKKFGDRIQRLGFALAPFIAFAMVLSATKRW
jgi:hypothetical protein